MSLYNLSSASPLGIGSISSHNCVTEPTLASLVSAYKRSTASSYRSLLPAEISQLPPGELLVSPKVDGQLWFLILGEGEPALISPKGRVISGDLPLLKEAASFNSRVTSRTVLAGELFALSKGDRPRVGDITSLIAGGAEANIAVMGFFVFDLLAGGTSAQPEPPTAYSERLAIMRELCEGGKRVRVAKTDPAASAAEVQISFDQLVASGKAEGLVVRSGDGRIFKLKPIFTVDAVIVGYTDRTESPDQVRSLLLALMRPGGQFQIMGSCGNLGTDDNRRALHKTLSSTVVDSGFRCASSSGALYRFVQPEKIVEIRATDVQSLDTADERIMQMVLEFEGEQWVPQRKMPLASVLHPVLVRERDDKKVDATDLRIAQLLERCHIADVDGTASAVELPTSKVMRREVYAKTSKGEQAIRKLLLWKTNKEDDEDFSAYVVHWTDYSPGRKSPLKREVRLAPSEALATQIAEAMIEKNIKKGWEKVG